MGYSLEAQKKLMFYPTSEFETHRLLGLLGNFSIDFHQKEYIKNKVLGEEKFRELYAKSFDSRVDIAYVLYDYFLQQKDYDSIKTFIKYSLSGNPSNNTVIADLFAGESRWVDSFFEIMDRSSISSNLVAIANELDEDRYLKFKNKKHIKYKYNCSFEELQLPKKIVSLMLYNPPYGDTNGVRNVKHYLKMMLEKDLMTDYGVVVFVIRQDDALDILDILCENFKVNKHEVYKTHEEEYKKYKQIIFIARKLGQSIDLSRTYDMAHYQHEYNALKKIFEHTPDFKLDMYNSYQTMSCPHVEIDQIMSNFEFVKNSKNYVSQMDGAWKWFKEITLLKDMGKSQIKMPKNPKIGELAMLISSGYINGELSLEGGKAKHVVIGGTRSVTKEETKTEKGDDGKKVTTKQTIKLSEPYLNILCNSGGKMQIKQLGGADNS